MTSTLFLLPRDRGPLGAFLCHVRLNIVIQQLCRLLGDKIIQKKDINISIAVATEDALYVPVIKHADEKTGE